MFNTHNSIPVPILQLLHEGLSLTPPVVRIPTEIDVLELSCALWRLRAADHVDTKNSVYTIYSQELHKHVLDGDRTMARNIREYYSKKIMMLKLRGRELSKFRIDLAQFLTEDGKITNDSFKGMIYRLPEFYSYDMEVDHMLENVFNLDASLERTKSAKQLLPIKVLTRKTKYGKKQVFFLKDAESGACVGTAIECENKLLPLWKMVFDLGVPLTLQGSYSPIEYPFKHYGLRDWKLVNNINIVGN